MGEKLFSIELGNTPWSCLIEIRHMYKFYTLGTYFTSKIYKLASKYTTNQLGTSTT